MQNNTFSSGYSVPFPSTAASTLRTIYIKRRQSSKPQTTRDIHLQTATIISLYLPVGDFSPPSTHYQYQLMEDTRICVLKLTTKGNVLKFTDFPKHCVKCRWRLQCPHSLAAKRTEREIGVLPGIKYARLSLWSIHTNYNLTVLLFNHTFQWYLVCTGKARSVS